MHDEIILNKIRKLLKLYGASDKEIYNFIEDIQKDDEEDEKQKAKSVIPSLAEKER